jgi:ankyrin repeat protein
MLFNKINKFYLILLALCTTFHAQPMDRLNQDILTIEWGDVIGSILLGTSTLQNLLPSLSLSSPSINKTTRPIGYTSNDFYSLPKDIEPLIISYLHAGSLKETANIINSLSLTDKYLNEKINDPIFCLQLIKHLSEKFNVSNMDVCKALQTKAAKERFELQNELYNLCKNINIEKNVSTQIIEQFQNLIGNKTDILSRFNELYTKGVDLEFTYTEKINNLLFPLIDTLYLTPLMIASINNYELIPILLKKTEKTKQNSSWVNINTPECKNGITPLIFAVITRNMRFVTLLCENKNLEVNKQDNAGNTALLWSLREAPYSADVIKLSISQLILDAGADPEIANNANLTPLQTAQKIEHDKIAASATKKIQNAIERKYAKK